MRGVCACIVVCALAIVAASPSSRVQLERGLPAKPLGYTAVRPSDSTARVTLLFCLSVSKGADAVLTAALESTSDPRSVAYGNHLTIAEVAEIVRSPEEHVARVTQWLEANGIHKSRHRMTQFGDVIRCEMTAEEAGRLLDCQFAEHVATAGGAHSRTYRRCTQPYTVPSEIAPSLRLVGGAYRFPASSLRTEYSRSGTSSTTTSGNGVPVSPAVIRNYYGANTTSSHAGNLQAAAQFAVYGQNFSPDDVAQFEATFNLPNTTIGVVGFNNESSPGVEATLDVEYISGVGQGVPTLFWDTEGSDSGQEPFLTWLWDVMNATVIPFVFSVSYSDVESTLSPEYMGYVNFELKKLGAFGTTVFFSSGDSGAGINTNCNSFEPNFPPASPWVTSVGATFITSADNNETAASFSSGGFSNVFGRPGWQDSAVSTFLSNATGTLPPASLFNSSGRGIPDVAAFGVNFQIVYGGDVTGVAGTSCSSPTTAGIFSLINDELLNEGLPPLGYVTPMLYAIAEGPAGDTAFTDVTVGRTKASGTNVADCSVDGYTAIRGWDAATGLGSPNFQPLLNAIIATITNSSSSTSS